MESTAMGLPGVSFTPGLHICAFYRGPSQRDELLLPYLREGLAAGDKCICVTDDPDGGRGGVRARRRVRRERRPPSCSHGLRARPTCPAGASRSRR